MPLGEQAASAWPVGSFGTCRCTARAAASQSSAARSASRQHWPPTKVRFQPQKAPRTRYLLLCYLWTVHSGGIMCDLRGQDCGFALCCARRRMLWLRVWCFLVLSLTAVEMCRRMRGCARSSEQAAALLPARDLGDCQRACGPCGAHLQSSRREEVQPQQCRVPAGPDLPGSTPRASRPRSGRSSAILVLPPPK